MNVDESRALVTQSVPIAGMLLFWAIVGLVVPLPWATTGARIAGVLVALLYVAERVTR